MDDESDELFELEMELKSRIEFNLFPEIPITVKFGLSVIKFDSLVILQLLFFARLTLEMNSWDSSANDLRLGN